MSRTAPSSFFARRLAAAALLLTSALVGCQGTEAVPSTTERTPPDDTPGMIRQDTVRGVYEVAYHPEDDAVYVASAPSFDDGTPGFVHIFDGQDLSPRQVVQLPRRAFALGLNNQTDTLYVGNTLDGSISVLDARGGMLKSVIQLSTPDDEGAVPHTRKVVVDEAHNRVFVSGPAREGGTVWIIDAANETVTHTVTSPSPLSAGLVYDAASNRLYVGQAGVEELIVIDPDTGAIVQRVSTGDTTENTSTASVHFFLNLSLDSEGGRLFATDSRTGQLYVLEAASGRILDRVDVGAGVLDVLFNPHRNEIYATYRGVTGRAVTGTGGVVVIDGTTYEVTQRIDLPPHPNSLALTPDGDVLYVTVKMPFSAEHDAYRADGFGSVVRVDLQ